MAEEVGLLIPLQFTLEEARASLKQLEGEARRAGQAAGNATGQGAAKGLGGLMQKLREFKSEQVQQGRQARFFAQEIMSIVPATSEAGAGLQSMLGLFIEGAAGGIGFGLALEGIRFAVGAVTAEMKREEAQLLVVGQTFQAIRDIQYAGSLSVFAATEKVTEGQKLSRAEMEKHREKLLQIQDGYDAVRKEGLGVWDRIAVNIFGATGPLNAFNSRLEVIGGNLRAAVSEARYAADMLAVLAGEDAKRAADGRANATIAGDAEKQRAAAKAAAEKRAADMAAANAYFFGLEEQYATRRTALLTQAEEAGLSERKRIELDYMRATAGLREGDAAAQLAALTIKGVKLDALDRTEYEKQYQAYYAHLDRVARAREQAGEAERRYEEELQRELATLRSSSVQAFASGAVAMFKPVLTGSAAYSKAMRAAGAATQDAADFSGAAIAAMLQNTLAGISQEAAIKALFYGAQALGYLATGNGPGAAAAGAAAAEFATVAAVAGVSAAVIGSSRGMTKSEKADVAAAQQAQANSATSTTSARDYAASGTSGGGEVTVRETVFVIGDPFESPAETARRAARTMALANRLDMQRRYV